MNAQRHAQRPSRPWRFCAVVLAPVAMVLMLGGCAVGAGVGFGIPLAPGLSLGIGLSNAGPSIGLSTGWGPLGAGVSLDSGGRVVGSAGVGVGAGPVGVGVGSSTVLYAPPPNANPPSVGGVPQPGPAPAWRSSGDVEAP